MSFYVEVPNDDDDCPHFAIAVVSGSLTPYEGFGGGNILTITGPPEFVAKHTVIRTERTWSEVEGPARMLNYEEYEAILRHIAR